MSGEKPRLAEVKTIHPHSLRDIPAGEFGDVRQCSLVILGSTLEVFAIGDCDPTEAHYLLCCGAARLQEPAVRQGRD